MRSTSTRTTACARVRGVRSGDLLEVGLSRFADPAVPVEPDDSGSVVDRGEHEADSPVLA
jgi:hypothetical protein